MATTNEAAPNFVIVAGPNGSGKSTCAPTLLRDYFGVTEFVNADEIATRLEGPSVESIAIEAGREMIQRINELRRQRSQFAIETTLASRTLVRFIRDLKADGYRAHLIFLWLPSADVALSRVQMRVADGGHDVAEQVVRRRFGRGLWNLANLYIPIMDSWRVMNGLSPDSRTVIADGSPGSIDIAEEGIWNQINGASHG